MNEFEGHQLHVQGKLVSLDNLLVKMKENFKICIEYIYVCRVCGAEMQRSITFCNDMDNCNGVYTSVIDAGIYSTCKYLPRDGMMLMLMMTTMEMMEVRISFIIWCWKVVRSVDLIVILCKKFPKTYETLVCLSQVMPAMRDIWRSILVGSMFSDFQFHNH